MEKPVDILIARNAESFSFLYQETLDRLSALGQVTFFDPEAESPDLCLRNETFLYLPGGYPEKHVEALAQAESTRLAIREFARRGGHVVAECGGMMYLCESIVTDDGEYPMCGVLPYKISARSQDRRLSLGYRRFMLNGREVRGHEFHYTQALGGTWASEWPDIRLLPVRNVKDEPTPNPVILYRNVIASYTHLYNFSFASF